jgi:hypothetical protein
LADTDGDGCDDGEEVNAGTNPLDPADRPYPFGDVDRSGDVTAPDLQLVVNAVLRIPGATDRADVDGSGKIDAIDVQLVANVFLAWEIRGQTTNFAPEIRSLSPNFQTKPRP